MTGTFAQFVALGQQAADELLGHLAKYPALVVQSDELTKLPKAPFVSFGSESPDDIPDFFGPSAAANDPPAVGHGTGRDTYGGPLAPLTKPANEPAPRCRAWRIRFHDGTGATAVNTTDADHDEMLLIVCEQFGAERVAGVEPAG